MPITMTASGTTIIATARAVAVRRMFMPAACARLRGRRHRPKGPVRDVPDGTGMSGDVLPASVALSMLRQSPIAGSFFQRSASGLFLEGADVTAQDAPRRARVQADVAADGGGDRRNLVQRE